MLRQSIDSLFNNGIRGYFRVLLMLDPDDQETITKCHEMYDVDPQITIQVAPERWGYSQLHRYYNALCEAQEIRDNDLLVLWNDDAFMMTNNWHSILLDGDPNALVLDIQSNLSPTYVAFPAMRGTMYRVLGHYTAATPHVDSYIQDIVRSLGKVSPVDVHVRHDRPDLSGNTPDATFLEGREGLRHDHYFSPAFQEQIRQAIEKIKESGI